MKKFENVYQDAALMKKALLGEANESEQQELEKRLAECPDLQKVYEQLQNGETLRVAFGEYKNYSSKKAYESFLQKIGQTEPEVIKKPRTFRVWWSVAAAVVFLVIGLSFYMSNYGSIEEESRPLIQPGVQQAQLTLPDGSIIDVHKKEVNVIVDGVQVKYKEGVLSYEPTVTTQHEEKNVEEKPVKSNELIIPRGGENTVILADGTTVHLNAGSKLTYPVRFAGKRRVVALEGEAYFEVSKDTLRRFLVNAGDMEVEALGTAFNVKAYEEDDEVVTTLFEGSVRTAVGKEFVILSPDESAVFNKSSHILSVNHPTNASYARLWRTNELAFSGESLEEIVVLLNRMYNVEVRFLSNKIKGYSFSGVIRNNSLDNVFEIISLTAPITYVSVGDTIYLNEK